MSSATEPRPSFAKTALAIAWLALAGIIAGVGGYLVIARQAPPTGELTLTLPPADPTPAETGGPAVEASEPSRDPAVPAEGDAAEATDAAPESASTPAQPEATPKSTVATGDPPADTSELPEAPLAPTEPEKDPTTESAESGTDATGTAVPEAVQAADEEAGSKPQWQRFAATVKLDPSRPRIAVVVTGLGLSKAATEAAIKQLPAFVTLSFSPYARELNEWIALARVNGHEVMLDLPMEPVGFPNLDPGPHTLLTTLEEDENLERLDWILDRGTSDVGVAALMGSRFITSGDHLFPVLKEIKRRGLLFLDNRSISGSAAASIARQLGMPLLVNDRAIDEAQASRIAIDARLTQVERLALTNGTAVAMGQPYPVTIERLRDWTALLGARGFALVPITALVPEAPSG